jgi:carboxypeptidase C (cathepsin A)
MTFGGKMADEKLDDNKEKQEIKEAIKLPEPQDKIVTTEHSLRIGKKQFDYTVTTGTMILREEDEKTGEKARASIFYAAYSLKTDQAKTKRPITYSFNGGPGSSSVWMHLGMLGPKRVKMDAEGMPLPPPYELVDNEHTLLESSDLVFIDPVSTGYSRAVPGQKAKEFHGVKQDIQSVGDFIVRWTTRNQRWDSPKFLIGESYGTTRASGLSKYLQDRHGLYLNGIILISSVLNFMTLEYDSGNDLPYPLLLPTLTATAWYHHKLNKELQTDLQATLRQAEAFAANSYTLALMKGDSISKIDRASVLKELSRLTGVSENYLDEHNLRVRVQEYCKELRREDGLTVGRLDSRFTGMEGRRAGDEYERDPSYSAIKGPYTATFYDYVRKDLGFEFDIPYEIIKDLEKWEMDQAKYTDVSPDLREAFLLNPDLRVYVACGYYDMATPYFAAEYTFNHLSLPGKLAERVKFNYFEAGHMMYLQLASLERLGKELPLFIAECCKTR